ncbi:MAG: ParB N-terminal domain-containing protein [Planctomycetia bacterium]|nr:ParB N-terminal domain-containing protein [Planctomycetia bacterium]
MYIKDRIKELRRVPASELLPNPKNWRTHPEAQKNVLQGLLAEVGYADALIAREREDGSLELIDGHLRAETTPQQEVPVLVLDVSEAEADKILATLDPLSAMAGKNEVLLTELIQGIETQSQAVQAMLEKSLTSQETTGPVFREEIVVPEVFQVVVECESETQQGEVYERLRSEGFQCRLLNL